MVSTWPGRLVWPELRESPLYRVLITTDNLDTKDPVELAIGFYFSIGSVYGLVDLPDNSSASRKFTPDQLGAGHNVAEFFVVGECRTISPFFVYLTVALSAGPNGVTTTTVE